MIRNHRIDRLAVNVEALATFVAILEEGSLVAAAERLHVTPSTITARLQTLEREIGHPLVHRSKSGATPTPVGRRIRRNAETMLALWEQTRRTAALADLTTDHVAIGCDPDLWVGVAARVMSALDEYAPISGRTIRHGSAADLADWQRDGLTDISVTYVPTANAGQQIRSAPDDELILVGTEPDRPTHFDPGYVFVDGGDDFARDHAAAFATAAISRITFESATTALTHLRENGGSAYIPRRLAVDGLDGGWLHHLHDSPVFRRPVFVVSPVGAADRWPWLDDIVAAIGVSAAAG